ncbi:MAG: tRNA preQ1(34) S-adenosylmethionine ribosyltransferase-isomerase QueA [Deltaproteobacteria bacterium]|nr:tRNA preQ1(34) S-adenosylmethionine ribosyltransferase-isomerase QueA [Deltaproteobacteria bacterium]
MYSIDDYDYHLPEENIAQHPVAERDRSRLLVMGREDGSLRHGHFNDLPEHLSPSDVLVVNNTQVIPARLLGKKETGGRVELLLLDFTPDKARSDDRGCLEVDCLVKASKRPRVGSRFIFDAGMTAEVIGSEGMRHQVRFSYDGDFESLLSRIGKVPLPPYIRRQNGDETFDDHTTYQTIYASQKGAVAAPTAGLHFTDNTLGKLRKKGVKIVEITLHVGYGTFSPVRVSDIRRHAMHSEWFSIPERTASTINRARQAGHRVVAVGTTCVRTLEFSSTAGNTVSAGSGNCDLFIYPGYDFKVVDAMVTNFHLPKSTLLMLVSALAGRQNILHAYRTAIEEGYRFYSYGDAMLIK